jgi:1-acyl-sn-glycerol-3-phosphate acyltransferase
MTVLGGLEAIAGGLLVFFVPGFFLSRVLFPEWRLRGAGALRRLIETLSLSFVLSVTLTVLVGYLLLTLAPGGFQAYWTDPVLEATLTGIAVASFGAGVFRSAYAREPPATRHFAEPDPGGSDAWELTRALDRLGREERRLRHALRTGSPDPGERRRLNARIDEIRAESAELGRRREAEYVE